ncbi:helix-turn-helix domain-containing protein [Kibdelosporangium lantanae]|uniref:Helix-turn-helix domain-containing protein n=1 Tax=Kibdelosporangium lantanae TaxID=1497396 RepID=A0ABW3MDX7_9PSEU
MAGFADQADDLVDMQVIPFPAITLVIDLGDGVVVNDVTGSVVAGMAPGVVRGHGRAIECLQIRLSPVVAHRVLGSPADLSGIVITLEDLWGRAGLRMQEQLRAASSWAARFAIAEEALEGRYELGRAVDPEVAYLWQRMVTNRGRVRVEALAESVGWSRTRMWSRFNDQIGLGPKRAAQLIRFDNAAHRLATGESAATVAAETGYADQSHLNREVMSFTGITPTAIAAAPWLAVDEVAWAGTGTPR